MKNEKRKQKALEILTTVANILLENSSRLNKYQSKISRLLDNACDLESRQEILNILLRSKHYELMERLNQLEQLMASQYLDQPDS